jgi:hypothetical protein
LLQMDSLVRIGASMQSSDPHPPRLAPHPQHELPPDQQNDAQAGQRPGSASADNFGDLHDEAMALAVQAGLGAEGQAAVDLRRLYAEAGKFPGAGTWVR